MQKIILLSLLFSASIAPALAQSFESDAEILARDTLADDVLESRGLWDKMKEKASSAKEKASEKKDRAKEKAREKLDRRDLDESLFEARDQQNERRDFDVQVEEYTMPDFRSTYGIQQPPRMVYLRKEDPEEVHQHVIEVYIDLLRRRSMNGLD